MFCDVVFYFYDVVKKNNYHVLFYDVKLFYGAKYNEFNYTLTGWFPTKRLKSKIQDPIFRGVRETGQPETGREKNSRSNF